MVPLGEVERIDARLAAQSQAEAALRLRLGQVLDVIGRGACFDLGFSSLAAYALERCERGVRWVEGARCLARRLEALPTLRRAVAHGDLSWSKAVLIARMATPADEVRWAEVARHATVRELNARLKSKPTLEGAGEASIDGNTEGGIAEGGIAEGGDAEAGLAESGDLDADEPCTLVCTVTRDDAWLFEATRALLAKLGARDDEEQFEALLAEAQSTLLDKLPPGMFDRDARHTGDAAQTRWREQLARWRAEAEARCEARLRKDATTIDRQAVEGEPGDVSSSRHRAPSRSAVGSRGCDPFEAARLAASDGSGDLEALTPRELDRIVRSLSRALAAHELELSRLILAFHRADGARHLGYATEAQYARERAGMSRSAFLGRRALAAKLEALPRVAEALGQMRIGVEAALQVVRVATPSTQSTWVDRARQRTIKHLREEVHAARVAVRLSGESNCPPPTDTELDAFQELERAAASGRIWRSALDEAPPSPDAEVPPRDASTGVPFEASAQIPAPQNEQPPLGSLVYGEPPASGPRSAWCVMRASLAEWLSTTVQVSAGPAAVAPSSSSDVQTSAAHASSTHTRSAPTRSTDGASTHTASRALHQIGRVVLRLRLSRATRDWWRGLEERARRHLPPGMSWLSFCCLSLWRAWGHWLESGVAYGHIYVRDRHRCTSPVCTRQDVTPHHLQFRSQGGSDDDANVAAVCTWCHLLGIHGGRIRAVGSAHRIRWELGRPSEPCLVVEGRERRAA
jgi:hypothetical protein